MERRTTGRLLAEIRFNPERRQRRIGTPDRTERKRTKRAGGTPRVFFVLTDGDEATDLQPKAWVMPLS